MKRLGDFRAEEKGPCRLHVPRGLSSFATAEKGVAAHHGSRSTVFSCTAAVTLTTPISRHISWPFLRGNVLVEAGRGWGRIGGISTGVLMTDEIQLCSP